MSRLVVVALATLVLAGCPPLATNYDASPPECGTRVGADPVTEDAAPGAETDDARASGVIGNEQGLPVQSASDAGAGSR